MRALTATHVVNGIGGFDMVSGQQPIADLTFVAFDTETTGFSPKRHRIIEIGAVKFRGDKVIATFQELISPGRRIPEAATEVHGITDEMVEGMPKIRVVLPRFIEFIHGAVPIAHSAGFDARFLSHNISYWGMEIDSIPVIDTLSLARSTFPHFPNHRLETLVDRLGIESNGSHRALEDAAATMEVFRECLDEMSSSALLGVEDLLRLDGPTLHFDPSKRRRRRSGGSPADEGLGDSYQTVNMMVESGLSSEIDYVDRDGNETTREITPISISLGRRPILIAFCHDRQDERHFRLDRIREIRVLLTS